jgi:signal transduction histidine kinase
MLASLNALFMNGDANAVRRLVLNLLNNALKHTRGGFVRVAARAVAADVDWVELGVADSGAGIPPEIRARLGHAFALNAGMVGDHHVKGAGLGLAICKGVAAAHGGHLEVRSDVGRGTTVTARLRADLEGPSGEPGEIRVVNYRHSPPAGDAAAAA